jgi:hypothetical protein
MHEAPVKLTVVSALNTRTRELDAELTMLIALRTSSQNRNFSKRTFSTWRKKRDWIVDCNYVMSPINARVLQRRRNGCERLL